MPDVIHGILLYTYSRRGCQRALRWSRVHSRKHRFLYCWVSSCTRMKYCIVQFVSSNIELQALNLLKPPHSLRAIRFENRTQIRWFGSGLLIRRKPCLYALTSKGNARWFVFWTKSLDDKKEMYLGYGHERRLTIFKLYLSPRSRQVVVVPRSGCRSGWVFSYVSPAHLALKLEGIDYG